MPACWTSSVAAIRPKGAGQWPLKLALWLGLCSLPLAGSLQLLQASGVVWPLLAYPLLSCVSFIQYWSDKRHAQNGRWRTPESTLQLTALLGGWPGAWAAQQVFRHKTRKAAFQAVFWASVLLHQLFWLDRLLLDGQFAALVLLHR